MKRGKRKWTTDNLNEFYPKLVTDGTEFTAVQSGTPTLEENQFVVEPPEDGFGTDYFLCTVPGMVIYYNHSTEELGIWNTSTGQQLNYTWQSGGSLGDSFEVATFTEIADVNSVAFGSTYYTGFVDYGDFIVWEGSPIAIDKETGARKWGGINWDWNTDIGEGVDEIQPYDIVCTPTDVFVINNFNDYLIRIDPETGEDVGLDTFAFLDEFAQSYHLTALPDGSLLMIPIDTPNDPAKITYANGEFTVEHPWGEVAELYMSGYMHPRVNIGHSLDGSMFFIAYDYTDIKAFNTSDGSHAYTISRDSFTELFKVHPVTGNIYGQSDFPVIETVSYLQVAEWDWQTGDVVRTWNLPEDTQIDINVMCFSPDGSKLFVFPEVGDVFTVINTEDGTTTEVTGLEAALGGDDIWFDYQVPPAVTADNKIILFGTDDPPNHDMVTVIDGDTHEFKVFSMSDETDTLLDEMQLVMYSDGVYFVTRFSGDPIADDIRIFRINFEEGIILPN